MKNGGYQIIDFSGHNFTLGTSQTFSGLYEKLNADKKTYLVSELTVDSVTYKDIFVTEITIASSSITLVANDYDILIDSSDSVTITQHYQLMNNIVDSSGNLRFVEGEGTINELEGLTITYNKWSLSGTHLMFVLAGEVVDETVINNGYTIVTYDDLPSWIIEKINVIVGTSVTRSSTTLWGSDFSAQTLALVLRKATSIISILTGSALTLTADRSFRIQYDLLIDTD